MLQLPLRWVVAVLLLMALGLTACEQSKEDTLAGEPTAVGGGALVLEETPVTETNPVTGTNPITDSNPVTGTNPVTSTSPTTDTTGVPPEPTPAGEVPSTPGTSTDPNATGTDPNAQPTTVAVDGATPEPGSEGTDPNAVTDPAAEGTYTVQAGDTLFSIAVQYNTTVEELITLNGLDPNQPLTVGQVIKVPTTATTTGGETTSPPAAPTATAVPGAPRTHTVQPGEWIYQIARDYGVDPQAIINANPGIDPNNVQPGQVLIIP